MYIKLQSGELFARKEKFLVNLLYDAVGENVTGYQRVPKMAGAKLHRKRYTYCHKMPQTVWRCIKN